MIDTRVFEKSRSGQTEMAERRGALTLSMRRVLIMVDGKRTVTDLAPLVRTGEIDGIIESLAAQGYIRLAEAQPTAPNTSSWQSTTGYAGGATDSSHTMSLDEARRRAVREIRELLGPDADALALRIEHATPDELRAFLREAERLIAAARGERAAQAFLQALRRP